MRRIPTRYLAVAGATLVLAVGIDATAYAANGSSLILGRGNTASSTTTMSSTTSAVPLMLRPSRSTAAPFAVGGSGLVHNLNADRLDSLHANDLQRRISTPCPDGRFMTGVYWSGKPMCVATRATTTVHAAAARGPFDVTRAFDAPSVGAGTYSVVLTASLQPTVRGTASAPKFAECTVTVGGKVAAVDVATDVGYRTPAAINAVGTVVVGQSETPRVACGFDRGTWSFSDGRAPTLAMTPLTARTSTPLTLR